MFRVVITFDVMATKNNTLPFSETLHEDHASQLTCLILIGHHPRYPVARILDLRGVREVHLGRGDEDDLRREGPTLRCSLADRWMSSAHAVISCFPAGEQLLCVLEDQGSMNGCRVNDEVVTRHQLQHGDIIETGQTYWKFHQRAEEDFEQLLEMSYTGGEVLPTSSVSLAMLRQVQQMNRVADTDIPVILLGESGTGKEVMTAELHAMSGRGGNLVALNCAAIPDSLIESELFGYRRGAFTGAVADKRGVVAEAHRGTLFLDEVGDMPLEAQAKLLRLLQEQSYVRVGDTEVRSVDARFVAATNQDLEQKVRDGSFRGDLFARLNGISLQLPALRERREDLGLLLSVFFERSECDKELTLEARRAVMFHGWPFNIRELEKAVTSSLALSRESSRIKRSHLPAALMASPAGAAAAAPAPPAPPPSDHPKKRSDEDLRARLVEALATHAGNVAAVARALETSRAQVHRMMKRVSLDPGAFRGGPDPKD